MPCKQCGRDSHTEEPTVAVVSQDKVLIEKTKDELRSSQLKDPVIGYILRAKENDEKPEASELKGQSLTCRRLAQLWECLEVIDGMLWRHYEDDQGEVTWKQFVVPQSLREEVLQELHAGVLSGHLGEEKTIQQLKKRFYWPGYSQDVRDWCHTCATCATRKTPAPKNRAPLQTIKAGYPMQVVAVDIVGPFPESESGNTYVLVAGDYFTRWMEAYAIPNQEATTVAQKLVDELFCRFSPPEQLHSDQGKQFESDVFKEVCGLLNIMKTRTTAYHPQRDGLVERFNRTLQDMIATTVKDHPFDWEQALPKVCMAYNTSVHSTTGYTPFYLMFGREARLPIDIVYGTNQTESTSVQDYARVMKKSLGAAYDRVRVKLSTGHKRQKEIYDKKIHGDAYEENDLVWLHNPAIPKGKSKKLHHPWTGPYRVIKKLSECDYRIKHDNGKKPPMVVHFNRLKRCLPGTRFMQQSKANSQKTPQEKITTPVGTNLQIVDDDDLSEDDAPDPATSERRYPTRCRQPPERYSTTVTH